MTRQKDVTEYPVAELIVAAGFFVVLSLEQIVMGYCVQKPAQNGQKSKSPSTEELQMNGIKKSDSPVFTNGQISDGQGETSISILCGHIEKWYKRTLNRSCVVIL